MGGNAADNQAIGELVNRHYAVLYRFAYRLTGNATDAEDLTQQTFLTAQRKIHQLREKDHSRSWLFTIARNGFLKSLRSQPTGTPVSLDAVGEPEQPDNFDVPVDSERLQAALNELTEEFRIPLILYYFKDFSYKDIARQMELPMGTVMSRLARGKAFLRRRLADTAEVSAGSERESRDRK